MNRIKHAKIPFVFLALTYGVAFSASCDYKPGYLAHGLIKDSLDFKFDCAQSLGALHKSNKYNWYEIWTMPNDENSKLRAVYIVAGLSLKNYSEQSAHGTPKLKSFVFTNGKNKIDLTLMVFDETVYVGIGGLK
jgi:hypothetical protein